MAFLFALMIAIEIVKKSSQVGGHENWGKIQIAAILSHSFPCPLPFSIPIPFYFLNFLFQAEIRTQLNDFLIQRHDSIPAYIRNKAIKLIVDIAASDWPHFYPNFFTNLLELLRRKETLSLGLNMLLITSEEARPCSFIQNFISNFFKVLSKDEIKFKF